MGTLIKMTSATSLVDEAKLGCDDMVAALMTKMGAVTLGKMAMKYWF